MAKAICIDPFPTDIDRDAFGHWLSGFTDGEGCFVLRVGKAKWQPKGFPTACYQILLRCDDRPILERIHAYFGCGSLCTLIRATTPNGKPQTNFTVRKIPDLMGVVVPHFDRFPLHAKKARDYVIWRKGVELLHRVHIRKRVMRHVNGNCRKGCYDKWTDSERDEFASLATALRAQRVFKAPTITPPSVVHNRIASLFD